MINFRYGIGHSLLQSNQLAPVGNAAVVAGMIVNMDSSNSGGAVGLGANSTSSLLGFAINNATDSDVLASGQIAMILLDGNTVIETDQVYGTINVSNFPNGTVMYPQTGGTGLIIANNTVNRAVGNVVSIRSLPGLPVTVDGFNVQGSVTVLGVKLAGGAVNQ